MAKDKGKKREDKSSSSSSSQTTTTPVKPHPKSPAYQRDHVILLENNITSISSTEYPGVHSDGAGEYANGDTEFDLERFKRGLKVEKVSLTNEKAEFDLIGVDASIANAMRRIMISEVPTMAIEKVFVMNNTSIIHDEILAHRLGLIPISADPSKFEFMQSDDDPTDLNTIVFKLQVKCEKNPNAPPDATNPAIKYINSSVTSKDLRWLPQGDQEQVFTGANVIRPVHDDILIAKLRPGQEIDVELHCQKGIGKTHAKWSPVAPASYRLMPDITLLEPVEGELAEKLKNCFPQGVIEVKEENGKKVAKVANSRLDTTSREVYRHEELAQKVCLAKKRDHFIFTIESVGIIPAADIVRESIKILIAKTHAIKSGLARVLDPDAEEPAPAEEGGEEQEDQQEENGQKGEEKEEEEGEEQDEEDEEMDGLVSEKKGGRDDDDDD